MNCDEMRPWLSALHDGETTSETQEVLNQHLAGCAACRAELADWRRLSRTTTNWTADSPSPPSWQSLSRMLATDAGSTSSLRANVVSARPPLPWSATLVNAAIIAATMALVLLGATWTLSRVPRRDVDERRLSQTLDRYMETFRESPERAQYLLDASFPSATWAPETAPTWAADSRVASRERLSGLTRVSMHVRQLPCCECIQGVYRRGDGSCVSVFEHEMPMTWTRDAGEKAMQCGDCVCRLRNLDQRLAASWSEGARSFTVVGVQGGDELQQLVEQLRSP